MPRYDNYTNKEMQAVTIAKQIKDGNIAIVGTGLPLIGASLAKAVYAPDCYLIVESGLMDCNPIEVPRSVGDNRFMAHAAVHWTNATYVGFQANEYKHDKKRMIAFIGGAQIDPYGNVNSTVIGDYNHPKTRFTGSGGANGIATYVNTIIMMQHQKKRMIAFIGGAQIDPYGNVNSTVIGDYNHPKTRFTGSGGANGIATYVNTIIMMQHQKRRFINKIDYVTSPGWIDGPGGRERVGIPGNVGPQMVVTDLGILKFDEKN